MLNSIVGLFYMWPMDSSIRQLKDLPDGHTLCLTTSDPTMDKELGSTETEYKPQVAT